MKSKKRPQIPSPVPAASDWRIPRAFIGVLSLAWMLLVLGAYIGRTPPNPAVLSAALDQTFNFHWFNPYLMKALLSVVLVSGIGLLATEVGHRLRRWWLPFDDFSMYEDAAISLGLGLAVFSYGIFVLGICGAWYPSVFWSMLGGAALLCAASPSSSIFKTSHKAGEASHAGSTVALSVVVLFFLMFLIGELTPEIFYDALFYHLAIPNLYRIGHRIVDFPTSVFSNFVMTVQRLYGLGITLGNDTTAKLIHGLMGVGLGSAFVGFGQRFLSKHVGIIAAALYFSMPFVGINIVTCGIDIGWSFFQVLAGYALMRTLLERDRRWTRIAGVFAGLAASCRYPGFSYLPIGFFILFWKRRVDRLSWPETLRELAEFTALATLMLLPMFIRNLYYHGNPVYPFGALHIGHPRMDPHYWSIFDSEAGEPNWSSEFGSWLSAIRFLGHPWVLAMEGHDNGTFVGPVYLLILPFVFFLRAPNSAFLWLRRYCGLLWAVWMVSSKTPRYGMAALALIALLLAETLTRQCRIPWLRPLLIGGLLLSAFDNFTQNAGILYAMEGWAVLGGLESKSDYLSAMHASYPTPPYEGIDWMNHHLPPQSKILFAGESRNYYSEFEAIPASVHDPEPLMLWSHESQSADALAQRLKDQHITHLFLNYAEAIRNESYGAFHWDAAQWKVFDEFWNHRVVLMWKKEEPRAKALYVYRLLDDAEAQAPHDVPPNPFARWNHSS